MLKVKNVEKYYGSKNNVTKALDRVIYCHYGGIGQREDNLT